MFPFSKLSNIVKKGRIIHLKDEIEFEKIVPLDFCTSQKVISFIGSKKYLKQAEDSKALAFIISEELSSLINKPSLVVPNVDLALVEILEFLYPKPAPKQTEIGNYKDIHSNVSLGKNVKIGSFVSIGENSKIGDFSIVQDGTKIGKNVHIGKNAHIGYNCVFYDNLSIGKNFVSSANSTFGSDGFRFVFDQNQHRKMPQVGSLIIGDHVEIQANCSIDRGGLGDTVIGNFCKIDNQVHIAHNCVLGENVIIAGSCGVAGSTKIGDNVIIGGKTAISDHLEITSDVIIAGGSVIRKSILEKGAYAKDGSLTIKEFQKYRANLKNMAQLNKWLNKISDLEKKLQNPN